MLEVDKVLEHFGIQGMRWGIRRSRKELDGGGSSEQGPPPFAVRRKALFTPRAEVVKIKAVPGKGIQTSGGKHHPTTDEAQIAAVLRQRAKASGVRSLSNQDIQLLVNRMNLEQSYAKMNPAKKNLGQKALEEVMYGSTPQMALDAAKPLLAGAIAKQLGPDPKNPMKSTIKVGLDVAEAIIKARPKRSKK